MSGIVLESAYYGDERAFANITQSLAKRIVGGVLDVTADAQLKPAFEAAPETRLDSRDQKRIREEAVRGCGGESDQACLSRNILKLSEERILEKEKENLSKSVIKGDRLTINLIDNGRRRKIVTPAGQQLRLENLLGTNKAPDFSDVLGPSKIQEYAISIITIVASTFFWVFSVAATYAVFMRYYNPSDPTTEYYRILAYAGGAAALLFPGFGYVIIFLAFAIPAFTTEYIGKK